MKSSITMTLNSINNILVIKFKHIGDVLVTTPLFRNLRMHFPDARICASVLDNTVEMLSDNPDIDAIFTVNRRAGLWTQLRLIRELRRNRFDLVIDLSEGDRGAFTSFLTGCRHRLGYRRRRRKFLGRDLLFTDLMDSTDGNKHAVRYHLEPLRTLGLPVKTEKLRLQWADEVEEKVNGLLRARGLEESPFVVVHPTSRWLFKSWTPEGNAAVIDFLWESCRLPVVVTGSDSAHELAVVRRVLELVRAPVVNLAGQLNVKEPEARPQVADPEGQSSIKEPAVQAPVVDPAEQSGLKEVAALPPVVDLAGRLNLKELAALIEKAALFFGVDTAPMHIAAAVGTPVVALFGPSGNHMWGPWGHSHVVISQPWSCRPCGRAGCNDGGTSRCLTTIEPQTVIDILAAKLRDLGFTPSS
jgi:heptosyltransferase III